MSLYKRGQVYWYEFEFRGIRHRGSTYLRNERKAEQFENKIRTDLALDLVGLTVLKPGPPFEKYAQQFREFIRVENAKHPRTVGFYEEKLNRLLEYKPLADCRLNQIDENLINEYKLHRSKKVKPATVNRELATLRRALHVARDIHKLISRVPKITIKLKEEQAREFVLTYEQEKAYLAAAEDTLRDFATLCLDTGLRAGEAVTLEWVEVYVDGAFGGRLGYIHIREGGAKHRERQLSMTPRVLAMLTRRRRFCPEEKFVFSGRSAEQHIQVSSIDHQHVRARNAAKVEIVGEDRIEKLPKEFVIHSLRHTFGTRLGESGADAFTIMKLMGHSSVTVSQKYVHPTPDTMEQAFERLEKMNSLLRGDQEAERKLGVPPKSRPPLKGRR